MDIGKRTLLFGEEPLSINVDDPVARSRWLRDDVGVGVGDGSIGAVPWRAVDLVVDQILRGHPPEVWATAQRLAHRGMARHVVLENLAMAAMSVDPSGTLRENPDAGDGPPIAGFPDVTATDSIAYAAALDRLPAPASDVFSRSLTAATRELQPVAVPDLLREAVRRQDRNGADALALVAADVAFRRAVAGRELAIVDGGLVVEPASLTSGVVLTTRLATASVEAGEIPMDDDLAGFLRTGPDLHVSMAGGAPVPARLVRRDGRVVLVLAEGSLGRLVAIGDRGDPWSRHPRRRGGPVRRGRPGGSGTRAPAGLTIAVRISGNRVDLQPVGDAPLVDDAAASAVRRVYDDEVARTALPPSYEDIVLGLLARDVRWFDVTRAPLSDLCRSAGLVANGSSLAHDPSLWARENQFRLVRRLAHRLPSQSDRAGALAVLACARPGASRQEVRGALTLLQSPAVMAAVVEELLEEPRSDPRRLSMEAFAELLLTVARTSRDEVVPRWLAARAAEQRGLLEVAEENLRLAIEADPTWAPAVERLAWYRGDRGDAIRAAALWRQAGMTDHAPELAVLIPFLPPPGPRPTRRAACWCGSGKPFARCHRDRWSVPALADRVGWLYQKAVSYVRHRGGPAMSELRLVASALAGFDKGGQARFRSITDPLVVDLTLHELGWFDRFLHERATLLPPDESALGRQWTSAPRTLFRVDAVDAADSALHLVDRRTGEGIDAHDPTGGDRWAPGYLVCARVLPDGAGLRHVVAAFGVSPASESAALEILQRADAPAIARFAGSEQERPLLLTSEREPLVECLAVLAVTDPPSVRQVLDRRYRRRGPGLWVEEHELAGGEAILRARLRLHETRLRIDARSEARLDRVLGVLARDLPELTVIWDRRDPVTAPRRAQGD